VLLAYSLNAAGIEPGRHREQQFIVFASMENELNRIQVEKTAPATETRIRYQDIKVQSGPQFFSKEVSEISGKSIADIYHGSDLFGLSQ